MPARPRSLLQVADGGMARIGDILQRMKALAVQGASGSVTDNERAFLDKEYGALNTQINAIANQTKFNSTILLNGCGTPARVAWAPPPSRNRDLGQRQLTGSDRRRHVHDLTYDGTDTFTLTSRTAPVDTVQVDWASTARSQFDGSVASRTRASASTSATWT